jgi:hypothetical protein
MIKRKLKPCKQCLKPSYLFGRGLCQSCYKRQQKKPTYKPKPSGELELFKKIWSERPHVSEISGKPLGKFNVCYFSHVISKGSRPDLRDLKENILLMTFEEHQLWEFGTRQQIADSGIDFSKAYERKEKIKNIF